MKTTNKLLIAILMIFPLICGFLLGVDYATPPIKQCEICNSNSEIEANTAKLVHNMCIIFDRHCIYDADGSDEMSELLEASDNLSNLYNW